MDFVILKKRFKDGFYYMGASILKLPIALVTSPIFAKNLSSADFAALGYFNALGVFMLPILSFSFMRYYMKGYHNKTEEENKHILTSMIKFLLFFDVIIVLLAYLALSIYLNESHSDFNAYPLGIIVFVNSAVSMGINFWSVILRFERKSKQFFFLKFFIGILITMISLLFVVYFKYGASGKLLGPLILNTLVLLYFIKHHLIRVPIDWQIIKSAFKFCYPLVLAALVAFPIRYVDRILLEQLHNIKEFAFYNISATIVGYFGIFTIAILQVFEPDIFKLVNHKKKGELITIFFLITSVYLIGSFTFYLISFPAVDYLTAGRYLGATKYILPNIIISCLEPISYFLMYIIIAMGFSKIFLFNNILFAIISIFLFLYLINSFEFNGALLARIIILLIISFISIIEIYIRKHSIMIRFKATD